VGPREVQLILEQIDALPTLAPIATRLLHVSASDDYRVEEVTRLIESDPALTARILRMCSRADTGLGDRVTTVRRAVVMLGIDAVRAAVLAVCVFDLMDGLAAPRPLAAGETLEAGATFDRPGFWQHAIGVACASELLARGRPDVKPDDAFVAGLLHDLGTLALHLALPQTLDGAVAAAARTGAPLAPVLRKVTGTDQFEAGRRLGRHWGLPEAFIECMWMHGQPASAVPAGPARELILTVSMGKAISRALHLGWSGGGDAPMSLERAASEYGADLRRVGEVARTLHARTADRCGALGLGETASPDLLLRSLLRANEGLARAHARLARPGPKPGRAPEGTGPADALAALELGAFLSDCPTETGLAPVARAMVSTSEGTLVVGVLRAGQNDIEYASRDAGTGAARTGLAPGAAVEVRARIDEGDALEAARVLAHAAGLIPDAGWNALVLTGSQGESRVLVAGNAPALNDPSDPRRAAWGAVVRAAAQYERAEGLAQGLVTANRALVEAQSRLSETEALARLGEVTSGAAHEMNNPLTVICGRAQLLAATLKSGPEAESARMIAGAARELSDLVTNLHALATPAEPRREPVDPRSLVRQAAALAAEHQRGPEGRGGAAAGVEYRAAPGAPVMLSGDVSLLLRAIAELIRNAWEAGSDAIVTVRAEAGRVEIEVRDHGPGFSAKALRHGFDPFFSERQAGRGRGLGLARCRALVRQHGGEVALSNAPGGGGRVVVSLAAENSVANVVRAA
jgi:signal transduction histidine kinase/HD-like signal output (HDOD) protein